MRMLNRWRAWRRAKVLARLRTRHGQPPRGLGAGQWIAGGENPAGQEGEAAATEEVAAKLKKLAAAIKANRGPHPPGSRGH